MSYILLVNTNRLRPRIAPLALDYLATSLTEAGFEVKIFDLAFQNKGFSKKLFNLLKRKKPLLVGISLRNLDDCYFLSGKFLASQTRWLIGWVKRSFSFPVVVGGVGYSLAPGSLLKYLGADFGIYGDGEGSMVKLAQALAGARPPEEKDMPGLVLPDKKPEQRAEFELKNFFPQRSFIANQRYFQLGGQMGIETKRGCDGKCIYCADLSAKGKKFRLRSPESVVEELKQLVAQGIWAFHLCDSEFNRPYYHSVRVLEAIIRSGLGKKIKLWGYFSPKPFDEELARLYARAGGAGICFGADSGSEKMLKRLGRDHSPEELVRAVQLCRKYQIRTMLDLLLGAPGENRKTLRQTISLMKKIKPERVGVSFGVRVFAHTPLEKFLRENGGDAHPGVIGDFEDNPELVYPVFYLEPGLQKDGLEYLKKLIDDDPRFFLPSSPSQEQNYNYSQNLYLERLIKKGARGAYWDILAQASSF